MSRKTLSGKALKKEIYDLLKSTDFDRGFQELCQLPSRKVINPLFSLLHNTNQDVKWAAVEAMGAIVAKETSGCLKNPSTNNDAHPSKRNVHFSSDNLLRAA